MIRRARQLGAVAESVVDRAAAVLGHAAVERYAGSPQVPLTSNRDIQLAGFITTQMHLQALQAAGVRGDRSLGLSLGEYSHLVHIGALSFEAALALVDQRGAAYDSSPDGVMVAILGATEEEVASAVTLAASRGTVVISNYNAPTQHVIAGERAAVEWAAQHLEDEFGASCIETESRVPMHSPVLMPVAATFRPALSAAPWQPALAPYLPNVTGQDEPAATDVYCADVYVRHLAAHVTEPVRWRSSIEMLAAAYRDACFIEVGPGSVVHNMLSRRWIDVRRARTDAPESSDPSSWLTETVRTVLADA